MTFPHGKLSYSPGIHHRVAQLGDLDFAKFVNVSLYRHLNGDFGDCDEYDRQANINAIEDGNDRIMSIYISQELRVKIWIISEADRSATAVWLPEEYQKGKLRL